MVLLIPAALLHFSARMNGAVSKSAASKDVLYAHNRLHGTLACCIMLACSTLAVCCLSNTQPVHGQCASNICRPCRRITTPMACSQSEDARLGTADCSCKQEILPHVAVNSRPTEVKHGCSPKCCSKCAACPWNLTMLQCSWRNKSLLLCCNTYFAAILTLL